VNSSAAGGIDELPGLRPRCSSRSATRSLLIGNARRQLTVEASHHPQPSTELGSLPHQVSGRRRERVRTPEFSTISATLALV
jgi:hypothetical protein